MSDAKITPAQQRALDKYKAKVNRFTVDFPPADMELWEHLQKIPKGQKQTYIKALIRADMVSGHWQDMRESSKDVPHSRCSVCGRVVYGLESEYRYCPGCGTEMERGGENAAD